MGEYYFGGEKEESTEKVQETRTLWHEFFDWIDCIGITFLCVFLALSFAFRIITIDGDSMMDTLINNEKVVISNINYTPKQGDIVVISRNYTNDTTLNTIDNTPIIKRVIATEGQWIDINFETGKVCVGETVDTLKPLDEEYVKMLTFVKGDFKGPVQIKQGRIFVMGDNRRVSLDSRYNEIGQADTRYILGKAYIRLAPFNKFGSVY